jgi:peptidoglycan/xylan/chitin deacetylase (PgdA/CDA1 family)
MKKLTLSFDNGPTPGITERVLAILARQGIKATWMVLGKNIQSPEGQELLRSISAAGHWIGDHSMTHSIAFGEKPDTAYAEYEILETQRLIAPYAHPNKYFRPFGNGGLMGPHLLSEEALSCLVDHQFTCLLWNSIPRDWNDPEGWVERGLAQAMEQDWTVVVLHDIPGACVNRLEEFITRVREQGIEIVQEIPDSVLPIQHGRVIALPDLYVAGRVAMPSGESML